MMRYTSTSALRDGLLTIALVITLPIQRFDIRGNALKKWPPAKNKPDFGRNWLPVNSLCSLVRCRPHGLVPEALSKAMCSGVCTLSCTTMLGPPVLADVYVGYAAGLSVSLLWTATSLFFTAAGRRIGATNVNAARIALAIILLGVTHRVAAGTWLPPAQWQQVAFLAASGIIGLAIGDQALFSAFVLIGPRLSMLIMTTAPLLAALFGWLALGETIAPGSWIGILLTVGGVAWVVRERPPTMTPASSGVRARGLILALIGAACQAGGLLLSKQGIGHGWMPEEEHMGPQAATLVRMVFAGVGVVPILLLHMRRAQKQRAAGIQPPRHGSQTAGYLLAAGGSVVGPYLGVWMSLVAAHHVQLGIAQTLTSLPPVLILPFAWLIHKERISPRAVVGAVVAVAGVILLAVRVG